MKRYIVDEQTLLKFFRMEDIALGAGVETTEERLSRFKEYEDNTPKLPAFFRALTSTEETALKNIIDTIGEEGNFSVVKLIQSSGISRSVFVSLHQKLKEFNIAEVENQGVKGTHIKFIAPIDNIFFEENE